MKDSPQGLNSRYKLQKVSISEHQEGEHKVEEEEEEEQGKKKGGGKKEKKPPRTIGHHQMYQNIHGGISKRKRTGSSFLKEQGKHSRNNG